MRMPSRPLFAAAVFALCAAAAAQSLLAQKKPGEENTNLLKNGHFDDAEDPLNHWLYVFDHNKHYMKNHTYVSVVEDKASARPHVLRLDATIHEVCINQGVMAYTEPIRFDPKKRYKISFSARSIGTNGGPGPKCRIYPIGYRWHPKAVKSNTPAFADLREEVRFPVVYLNNAKTGEFSNVPSQWKRAESMIPSTERSDLQEGFLENCEWLMLKFLALDATGVDKCNTGYLYVDDVKIEELGPANAVQLKAGAATKGFDGQSWSGSKAGEDPAKKFVPVGGPVKAKSGK
ncbi:MAG: hypothetical protein LBW77_02740 [Verrucomicrobiota bacterium]|jgi:hypothetical protein|nr:hypothetical protein [Verrucomicrobiota bacterium]